MLNFSGSAIDGRLGVVHRWPCAVVKESCLVARWPSTQEACTSARNIYMSVGISREAWFTFVSATTDEIAIATVSCLICLIWSFDTSTPSANLV
jgi:hypothetical protein